MMRHLPFAIVATISSLSSSASAGPAGPPPVDLSPPRLVSEPVYDEADFASLPAVASDGTNSLVVWKDLRIRGTRVDSDGRILDPVGFDISPVGQSETNDPAVAWGEGLYLVVWATREADGPAFDLFGARVDARGRVLDPDGIPINTSRGYALTPSISWDGTHFLVVWDDYRGHGAGDIYGTRVTLDGSVIDASGFRISPTPGEKRRPDVEWDGRSFLVVWAEDQDDVDGILGIRVSPEGFPIGGWFPISTAGFFEGASSIAWSGTYHLVVWQSFGDAFDVFGARVTTHGEVLDPSGIPIRAGPDSQTSPSAASNGTDFLVTWSVLESGTFASRVSADGEVMDDPPIPVQRETSGSFPDVAWGGKHYQAVWEHSLFGIHGARIGADGVVLDIPSIPLSVTADAQYETNIGWDGTNFLAVWDSDRSEGSLFAGRLTRSGRILDGAGLPLPDIFSSDPRVAGGAENFLVVWRHYGALNEEVFGARVSATGQVLDPEPIEFFPNPGQHVEPAVASNGMDFLVVWEDHESHPDSVDVRGARLSAEGKFLDAEPIPISTASGDQGTPAIAWTGQHYLVVWRDDRAGTADVYGARVLADGTVLDQEGIPIGAGVTDHFEPAVASDGSTSLVVWEQGTVPEQTDLYAARVNQDGQVLDPVGIPLAVAKDDPSEPRVAWTGRNFFVAWERRDQADDLDVYGTRVGPSGSVVDVPPIPLASTGKFEWGPALVSGSTGRIALVFHRFDTSRYATARAFLRFIDERP